MSVRQADVKKITHLTGLAAFKVRQQELGVALIDNLPMGSGSVVVPAPAAAASSGPGSPPGNWTYEGQPGSTDAYAPANAVASPATCRRRPRPCQLLAEPGGRPSYDVGAGTPSVVGRKCGRGTRHAAGSPPQPPLRQRTVSFRGSLRNYLTSGISPASS
jgi:hypothetical protein